MKRKYPKACGKELTILGIGYGIYREWYEYLPFIGDAIYRRRLIYRIRNCWR